MNSDSGNYRFGNWSRSRSFVFIVIAYAVSVTAALVAASIVDDPYADLIVGFAVSVAILYVVSQIAVNGSTFDAWWSVLPPVMAVWFALTIDDTSDVRRWLVVLCAVLWGARLTANWAIGWPGLHHEDWRYVKLYADAPMPRWLVSLTSVHLFPLVVVTLGSLPMVAAASVPGRDIGVLDFVAVVVVAIGVALEHFADVDLRRFNRTKQPGDVLDIGLWSRCRHPNYLGEMLWWWGLFLFAVAADPGSWWTGVGALAMTIMFLTASIPFAEKRSQERRPGWAEYCERTPLLIPRLRSR
jgi:steroid 5-alpha reductase family enzyme